MFTPVPGVTNGAVVDESWGDAVAAAATELETLASDGQVGIDNAGPTSAANELTVTTVTLPAPGVAGRVTTWARIKWTQSNGGDSFIVRLKIGATTVAYWAESAASSPPPAVLMGGEVVDGLSSVNATITIARTAGAGTATVVADQRSGLEVLFVPAP